MEILAYRRAETLFWYIIEFPQCKNSFIFEGHNLVLCFSSVVSRKLVWYCGVRVRRPLLRRPPRRLARGLLLAALRQRGDLLADLIADLLADFAWQRCGSAATSSATSPPTSSRTSLGSTWEARRPPGRPPRPPPHGPHLAALRQRGDLLADLLAGLTWQHYGSAPTSLPTPSPTSSRTPLGSNTAAR